jgi:EmrB/QacA subfamily drug resistance transporter
MPQELPPADPAPVTRSESPLSPEAHPRRWLIFGIVALGMLMGNIDQNVVATALPTLHTDLHTSISWAAWTVSIYQLGLVATLPVAGRLSDQFGRKNVYLISISLFSVCSLLCGLSTNIAELIVFRAVQALGAGGLMPSATGIVADHFGRDRDRGVGLFASIVPMGALIGPVFGGTIIYYWSWRGIFLINLPLALVVLPLTVLVIPQSARKSKARADLGGILWLIGLVLAMMLGVAMLGQGEPVRSALFIGPEIASVLCGVALVRHCARVANPIIPLDLLRLPSFARMNVINVMYGAAVLGFGSLIPLYAEDRFHFRSVEAGSVLSARAVGVVAVSWLATYLLRRTGYRRPMLLGFSLEALGIFLIALGPPGATSPYLWLAIGGCIVGIGAGAAIPATNNALLSFAPDNVASISGLRGMFKQIGAIFAISIVTTLTARSANPGLTLSHCLLIFAGIVVVVVLPLAAMVPDRSDRW